MSDHSRQAEDFIHELHRSDWRSLTTFEGSGHVFQLLSKGRCLLLVQIYPEGHGFEVWRPICVSNSVEDTLEAVYIYGTNIMSTPNTISAKGRLSIVKHVLGLLCECRMATSEHFPKLAPRIRSAIKSAQGAVRNAQRFVDQEGRKS